MQDQQTLRAHACFRLDIRFPIGDSLQLLGGESDLHNLWQSLSYRIIRSPDDLLAHTRRVRLCQEPALQARLAGALGDLAHVLGERGINLQRRLHAECTGVLADASALDRAMMLDDPVHSMVHGRVLPTLAQLMRSEHTDAVVSTP